MLKWMFEMSEDSVYSSNFCFSSTPSEVSMPVPNNSWGITVHIPLSRNEHYASFSQAWLGILTERLGNFPSYSYPPPSSYSPQSTWLGGRNPLLFSWTGLFPMCLWCRVWSVSLNGLYLFIPAAHRLTGCFPRSLPGAFLSWRKKRYV